MTTNTLTVSTSSALLAIAMAVSASSAFAQSQTPPAASVNAPIQPPDDPTYRSETRKWLLETLYPKKKEDAIYKEIQSLNMHYLYTGFLEAFPASAKRGEVLDRLKGYAVFETKTALLVSFKDLETRFNFDGVKKIYRWGPAFSSMSVGAQREQKWTGPVCLGNIQFLSGGFAPKEQGPELLPGTKFIYPTQKPSVSSAPAKK